LLGNHITWSPHQQRNPRRRCSLLGQRGRGPRHSKLRRLGADCSVCEVLNVTVSRVQPNPVFRGPRHVESRGARRSNSVPCPEDVLWSGGAHPASGADGEEFSATRPLDRKRTSRTDKRTAAIVTLYSADLKSHYICSGLGFHRESVMGHFRKEVLTFRQRVVPFYQHMWPLVSGVSPMRRCFHLEGRIVRQISNVQQAASRTSFSLVHSTTLKMEAEYFSDTSVNYRTARRHTPEI
jgi:hypothetical protein